MGKAHTVVQRVERGGTLLFLVVATAARLPAIGVLQIGFGAIGTQLVLCLQRINHVEVLPCVRNAIARRVAHLILHAALLHIFVLQRDGTFHVVAARLVLHHELHALHRRIQVVARMFEERAHAQALSAVGLRQPVLALNVEPFLLTRGVGRCEQRQMGVRGEVARDGEVAKIGAEEVFLPTVEVHHERHHVLLCTVVGGAVMGCEVIVVVGDVSDEVDGPALVGLVAQVGLVVEERRVVLRVDVALRGEQEARGLVAHAVQPRQLLRTDAQIGACSQQTGRDGALHHRLALALRLEALIADVECRRHLVAILHSKAARREADALHHIGIDDRESLLLAATHQERPEHLDVVDVDAVLVE